jgi:hypothetical protein
MRYWIGLDDTDNLDGPGTGQRARQLAALLTQQGLALAQGITRHQLLVSPLIRYTSHNSSACLVVTADAVHRDELVSTSRQFLLSQSAKEADAGLCVAEWDQISPQVLEFGKQAKQCVLTQEEAQSIQHKIGLVLEGLTGNGDGMIGALAAVGLRAAGNDGRFLWLPGLRELSGSYTAGELKSLAHIDQIQDLRGKSPQEFDRIEVGEWLRPVLRGGKALLLVEEIDHGWRVVAKEQVKRFSE